jgi:hypothetical protein
VYWARYHGLVPLYCGLIFGLADGVDPLARLLGVWPLPTASRDLALGLYLFQGTALAEGKSVIKCPSSLNVLKDRYDHSCY